MKVLTEVKDGSLVSQNEKRVIESALGRELNWCEVPGSYTEAGKYYQCDYDAEISQTEADVLGRMIRNGEIVFSWLWK